MKFRVWILGAALLMALTACGGGKSAATPSPPEESQTAQQSIHGTINQLGDYLILLEDKGEEYRIFDFGEGLDLTGLEEGDQVTVTYTGDLTEVDPAPVAVDIQKD